MRTLKYTLITLALLVVFSIGGYSIFKKEFTDSGQITKAANEISKVETQEKVNDTEVSGKNVDQGMSERELQQYLHKMSHGKVVADKKWGATPITTENVNNLIAIVEANDFEHKDFYLKHLNEWKNGNFNGAVEVHNRIWTWHGGTVGRATGLMSEHEEEKFISENFRD
ncbi:DUF6241 domain-containing protein [Planococcus shenhongbingii]|uniref:DUF6241 domain-containing protein n=1 Tax=Planococcus shenhongbingii TaxID=3058398 RepID=UPI00262B7757|nr:DUF6241 domain-containing protein [Planococcus sp. N016]WKA59960.1 DUF6241 domain-containing protein [Planococcus sp. N016]